MKRQNYAQCLYMYGYYSLLYLLEEYEHKEMYEECEVIVSVIDAHNKEMNDDLPTRTDNMHRAIQSLNKLGLSGRTYQKNLPMYVEIIKSRVEKYMKWEDYFKENPI